jgi:hypothetical protein
MNFSPASFLTVNHVVADVQLELNDEGNKLFTPGYYISQVQQAMEELSLSSFFHDLWKDFDFPYRSLSLELPKGAFNLKAVFAFNGDCCSVDSMTQVHYKRGYAAKSASSGYTARNKDSDNADYDPWYPRYGGADSVYFYSLQNGNVTFSSSCSAFEKVRLYYNGVLTNAGDVPVVPVQFRQAVKDYVIEKCYRILMGRDPRMYAPLYDRIHASLYAPITGTWDQAIKRASSMDSSVVEDYREYMSKMNY